MDGEGFDLSYELIVLDEIECLLSKFDEETINKQILRFGSCSMRL